MARSRPRARRKRRRRVRRATLDSSGFEAHHVSHYFVRHRAKGGTRWQATTYKRFPKLAAVCDCASHLILSAWAERGPGPDITHFEPTVVAAVGRVRLETLYADAGYDAEWVHVVGRDILGVRTVIPPKIGRPTDKPPSGQYRRLMWQRLHLSNYGQRWRTRRSSA